MPESPTAALHFRGHCVDTDTPVEFWTHDGLITFEPVPGADTVCDGGWITSGLVDAHNHVGIAPGLGVTLDQARGFARLDARAGALLIREVGSPLDTHPLDADPNGPRFIRSGRHIARTKRYLRGYGVELDDPDTLADEVRRQARDGDGWVKLVGDWIDREVGDLAPLWTDAQLAAAAEAAHAEGARITAHIFGTDALHGVIAAGFDCIEHGTGLTDDLLAAMAQRDIALVPTLIQVENFPSIADGADRFPTYQSHMRALHAGAHDVFTHAVEAGVPIYAGTDAGGFVDHGRIVDEMVALTTIGLDAATVVAAATVGSREWLSGSTLGEGERADLIVLDADPRVDIETLRAPRAVVCGGAVL